MKKGDKKMLLSKPNLFFFIGRVFGAYEQDERKLWRKTRKANLYDLHFLFFFLCFHHLMVARTKHWGKLESVAEPSDTLRSRFVQKGLIHRSFHNNARLDQLSWSKKLHVFMRYDVVRHLRWLLLWINLWALYTSQCTVDIHEKEL